jgi:elongation factor P hydroxylase
MNSDTLNWLQAWYAAQCNGEWEHSWGIKIDNIDNPGWIVTIDLRETELFEKAFEKLNIKRSELDWIMCFVKEAKFEIRCGPKNLTDALEIFRKFATP